MDATVPAACSARASAAAVISRWSRSSAVFRAWVAVLPVALTVQAPSSEQPSTGPM